MADLLSTNRESSARIRVENIIHTDITVELMEILELYAELLLARAGLLDVRDKNIKDGILSPSAPDETGLEEAAASIIYAAPRLARDVRELALIRAMLIERFGKDFALKANENENDIVPKRVSEKLRVEPPSERLVQAYLEEIARSYGVDWPRGRKEAEMDALRNEVDDEDDDGVGGGMTEAPILADGGSGTESRTPDPKGKGAKLDLGNLRDATPPTGLGGGAKSPVSVAPPGARSDNISPSVKLPGGGQVKKGNEGTPTKKAGGGAVEGKVPTVDDLAKRFQALKR
jgi:vacuolar protein sorting-associated protein IST1